MSPEDIHKVLTYMLSILCIYHWIQAVICFPIGNQRGKLFVLDPYDTEPNKIVVSNVITYIQDEVWVKQHVRINVKQEWEVVTRIQNIVFDASHQTNGYSCGVYVSMRSLYFAYYGRFPNKEEFSEVDDPMARLYIAKTIYGARELINNAAANNVVNLMEDDEDEDNEYNENEQNMYNNEFNKRPAYVRADNYDL